MGRQIANCHPSAAREGMIFRQDRIWRQHRELVKFHIAWNVEIIAEGDVEVGHAQAFQYESMVALVLEELDVWIGVGKATAKGGNDRLRKCHETCNVKRSSHLTSELVRKRIELVGFAQDLTRLSDKAVSGLGQ